MRICNWGFCHKEIVNIGYTHIFGNEFESNKELWEPAKEISEAGLNVMACHMANEVVLFVDNKRFSQR